MTAPSKIQKQIAHLRSNNSIILHNRRKEVEAEIRRLYLNSEFEIPRDCFFTPYTKIEESISTYCNRYDTSDIRTVYDIDIALNHSSLALIEENHPEYFI